MKMIIDLSGPEGNAFALMGYAKRYGKKLGFSEDQIASIIAEMTSGDYENLVEVFTENFGEYIEII